MTGNLVVADNLADSLPIVRPSRERIPPPRRAAILPGISDANQGFGGAARLCRGVPRELCDIVANERASESWFFSSPSRLEYQIARAFIVLDGEAAAAELMSYVAQRVAPSVRVWR
jgi:hypothetical protein